MLRKFFALAICALTALSTQAEIEIEDSRGSHTLEHLPVRVAALNWDIAEQVLELGVTPVAMPDIAGYKEWVVRPEVPESVQDIGTRVEPNLERLSELKPDIIIVASPQYDLIPRLERIAPVLYYQTYSEKHDNALAAIDNYKNIAVALGKESMASARLAEMERKIAELKRSLDDSYKGNLPSVAAFRFASTTSMYLYGNNSITQYALKQLGIEPALPQKTTQWGVTQKRIKDLRKLPENSVALYFKPFDQEKRLKTSVLWSAMPVVKAGKVNSVDPVWNYGGAMSILYNAQVLTKALLELAPET